jgi:hypothetical protein
LSAVLNPDIVTDGLVLCLDAFLPKSYPGVIYFLRVYNKALSYENINKNFQIIKQRFKL